MKEKTKYNVPMLYYILVGIIGLLLIFGGNLVPETHKFVQISMIELGIAAIIALIIIFTIERFQRDHQNKFIEETIDTIAKNLFQATYKKFIPEDILKDFTECLSTSKILRKNHKVYYDIKRHPESDELVICEASSRYNFENITKDEIHQKVGLFLERPLDPKHLKYCVIESIKIDGIETLTEENPFNTDIEHIKFETLVAIKPGKEVLIETKSKLVKNTDDVESWALIHPSDGIELSLTCEESLNLNLMAVARHPKKLTLQRDNAFRKEWKLNAGTFPYQSISLWWSKKR